ncbi:MAG TPA: 50S ribosomal protein L24 [Thermoguttaceae bacterium]|nr:50S ribosomal protein L24 [Thermoguttaceae bacterium]
MWIRVNDTVKVIVGDDQGAQGRVLRVDRREGKVVVEHVNRVYKHVRRSQKNPQGGRLSLEMPIPLSNVLLVCEKCGAATRLGARLLDDGSKERFCKKCGASNGQVAPAKARRVKK